MRTRRLLRFWVKVSSLSAPGQGHCGWQVTWEKLARKARFRARVAIRARLLMIVAVTRAMCRRGRAIIAAMHHRSSTWPSTRGRTGAGASTLSGHCPGRFSKRASFTIQAACASRMWCLTSTASSTMQSFPSRLIPPWMRLPAMRHAFRQRASPPAQTQRTGIARRCIQHAWRFQ